MLRAYPAMVVLAGILFASGSSDAQTASRQTSWHSGFARPGLAPLHPMLALPVVRAPQFPGLGHPSLHQSFKGPFVHRDHRVDPPHRWPHRFIGKHHAHGFHKYRKHVHPGFQARFGGSGFRFHVNNSPRHPVFRREIRDRHVSPALVRGHSGLPRHCGGASPCIMEVDKKDLAATGGLVCVDVATSGRCTRFVRIIER